MHTKCVDWHKGEVLTQSEKFYIKYWFTMFCRKALFVTNLLEVKTFWKNSLRAITINKKSAPINWRLISQHRKSSKEIIFSKTTEIKCWKSEIKIHHWVNSSVLNTNSFGFYNLLSTFVIFSNKNKQCRFTVP